MKAKLLATLAVLLTSQAGQAFACSVCFGVPQSKSTQSIAMAIWFMIGAVMSVLGGVGAFGYQIWRRSHMPLEPHLELTEEDLNEYD
jgi:putative Mn2+ efflux pump MntP